MRLKLICSWITMRSLRLQYLRPPKNEGLQSVRTCHWARLDSNCNTAGTRLAFQFLAGTGTRPRKRCKIIVKEEIWSSAAESEACIRRTAHRRRTTWNCPGIVSKFWHVLGGVHKVRIYVK